MDFRGKITRVTRFRPAGVLGMALAWAALLPSGCSRYEYVREANEEAYALIGEKADDPRWDPVFFTIELDPRSRYYDVCDEIEPPMPPDDPASHEFMHRVDGRRHWPYWHQFGDRPGLENPFWKEELSEYVAFNEEGEIQMGLVDAVRLAVVHSPEYQQQFETLFLSALDVSTERFRFDVQFFGFINPTFTHLGSERGPGGESNTLTLDSGITAEKQLATAGQLLIGFANSTVWEFVGPNQGMTTSVLNFSLIQPLLRAGGRAIALEQLTITERALLANVRALARWRKGFFTEVAIGDNGTQGPQRRGGFFGGTGLTGFTGQGAGGFGGVGEATGFGRGFGGAAGGAGGGAGATGFAGGGAGQLGGFLGLLQQLQQIRNSEQSLVAQLATLEQLEDFADLLVPATILQFRQSIETERANLLQARNGFQNSLENFLVGTLGLPPDTPVDLKADLLEPFEFIGEDVIELQAALDALREEFYEVEEPGAARVREFVRRARPLLEEVNELVDSVAADMARLEAVKDERLAKLDADEREIFESDLELMRTGLADIRTALARVEANLDALAEAADDDAEQAAIRFAESLADLRNLVGELSLIRARARLEVIIIEPVELDPYKALEIARCHRLDWMNNRAALVDTWRLIEFNANALKSDLSVTLEGDIQTIGDNPLAFRGETGRLQAGLQFDPPLTRLIERNSFRQQLIEYQQSRRQLIQFGDRVHQTLRQLLRQLELLEENLEIQRRAVALAIRRVEETRENLSQPLPPAVPGAPAPGLPETTAINLLTAFSDLRNTQNNFLSVWLSHYATRMVLMRELGLMQVDEQNVWIDEPLDLVLAKLEDCPAAPRPPDVPQDWIDKLGTESAPAPAVEDSGVGPRPDRDDRDDRERDDPPPPPLPMINVRRDAAVRPAGGEVPHAAKPMPAQQPPVQFFPRSRYTSPPPPRYQMTR